MGLRSHAVCETDASNRRPVRLMYEAGEGTAAAHLPEELADNWSLSDTGPCRQWPLSCESGHHHLLASTWHMTSK